MFSFFDNKNSFIKLLVVLLCLVFLFKPNVSKAFLGVGDTTISYNIDPIEWSNTGGILATETAEEARQVAKDIQMKTDDAIKVALISSLTQGLSYLTRKAAHDAAVFLASGATGQNPQVYTDGFGSYMKKVSGEAAIQSVNNLTKRAGLNICEIPNVEFMASLKVNLATIHEQGVGPKPDCNMADIKSNWTNCTPEQARDPDQDCGLSADKFMKANPNLKPDQMANQFVSDFKEGFTAEGSDFGIEMEAMARIGDLVAEQKEAKKNARLEGDGFKPVTNAVDNEIKTPASFVEEESKVATGKEQLDLTKDQLNSILGSNSLAALTQAGDVFLSTLASRVLDRVMNQGLLPEDNGPLDDAPTFATGNNYSSAGESSRAAAERAFAFFEAKPPSRNKSNFDYLSKISSCPSGPVRGIYNCVIDNDLKEAIIRSRQQNERFTIKEAMEEGYLHENWSFVPPEREDKDRNRSECYQNHYCYSNMKKLRKLRILPLGFEIAATLGNPDNLSSVTLKDVVDGFYDCNENGRRDKQHPYCHLIDPNWVIKAPEAQCNLEGYGPQLASNNSAVRKNTCMDIKTCVNQDKDNTCKDYGYCTREKTTWDVPGESCDAQYATCNTYFDKNGKSVSYLSRTIDFGICSTDSVGCRAYSLSKNNGVWENSGSAINDNLKQNGRNQNIFFNQNITNNTCSAEDRGCSEFLLGFIDQSTTSPQRYNKTEENVYIKQAPDYMGCYDSDPDTEEVEEPTTIPQAKLATANNNSCQNFSKACTEAEVGCKEWTSVANPSLGSIPGKVGNNSCNTQCVGYDVYFQEETVFEQGRDKNYFIPNENNVQRCSAEQSGCSEFTNLSQRGQGGENLEYYTDLTYCENPRENNQKTFYTWEGSTSQGYRIQTHSLAQYTSSTSGNLTNDYEFIEQEISSSTIMEEFEAGSPKYNFETIEQLKNYYSKCNADTYEKKLSDPRSADAAPDTCREYRDQNDNIYYRLEDKLLEVSSQCHKLRKTETNLVESNMGQSACEERGGNWNNGQCFVCRGGGTYTDNNFCVYQTVSTPNSQNSCIGTSGDRDRYNGCRPYRGNKSGNERMVIRDEFEPSDKNNLAQARDGWDGPVNVVGEALEVGGYSLRIGGGGASGFAIRKIAPNTLTNSADINYELSFWARGSNESISVHLEQENQQGNLETVSSSSFTYDQVSEQEKPASISGEWSQYSLGPISFMGDSSATTSLVIEGIGSGNSIFIDKFQLTRGENKIYAIKDSWEREVTVTSGGSTSTVTADVPLACDSNPTDNLPGEALGCELYEDSQENQQAATGFERLCRENAVGCRPVYDTHNSNEEGEVWYNAVCKRSNTQKTQSQSATDCEVKLDKSAFNNKPQKDEVLGKCTIDQGKDKCYVDKITFRRSLVTELNDYENVVHGALYNKHVDTSTVVIPADDYEDTPKFRTITQDSICDEDSKGCRKAGQQKQLAPDASTSSYNFDNEMFVLNDPDKYVGEGGNPGILCEAGQVGCQQYSSNSQNVYFKNPKLTGRECVYKEGVPVEGRQVDDANGWFKKGVGKCESNGNLCTQDSDCTSTNGTTSTCKYKGQIPCYENSQTLSNKFKLWSEDSSNYDSFVGTCPASQNQCTRLIDPADTNKNNPQGKEYHVIFDNKIEESISECKGQASRKSGCVLFDKTDNPEMLYNSEETYKESNAAIEENREDSLISPVRDGDLDSNIIMKVNRDRTCSQWLSCKNTVMKDTGGNKDVRLCTDYQLCSKTNDSNECVGSVNSTGVGFCQQDKTKSCNSDSQCPGNRCIKLPTELTVNSYASRDVSWYGEDYSGYSILNNRSVDDYVYLNIGDSLRKYMAYKTPDSFFIEEDGGYSQEACIIKDSADDSGQIKDNWTVCGFDNQGRCYEGACIKPISNNDKFPFDDLNSSTPKDRAVELAVDTLSEGICKAYPEETSPFPHGVLQDEKPSQSSLKNRTQAQKTDAPKRYDFNNKKGDYSRANVCQNGRCSCMYKKISYSGSSMVDYWMFNQRFPEGRGVCAAGDFEGQFCDPALGESQTCGGRGFRCLEPKSIEQQIGTLGFCLERDPSTRINGGTRNPCLSWLPIDVSASQLDIYNMDQKAGYYPKLDARSSTGEDGESSQVLGGKSYCLASTNYSSGYKTDSFIYSNLSGGNGQTLINDDIDEFVVYDNNSKQTTNFSSIGPTKVEIGQDAMMNYKISNKDAGENKEYTINDLKESRMTSTPTNGIKKLKFGDLGFNDNGYLDIAREDFEALPDEDTDTDGDGNADSNPDDGDESKTIGAPVNKKKKCGSYYIRMHPNQKNGQVDFGKAVAAGAAGGTAVGGPVGTIAGALVGGSIAAIDSGIMANKEALLMKMPSSLKGTLFWAICNSANHDKNDQTKSARDYYVSMMQLWGWRYIGPEATLLRAELSDDNVGSKSGNRFGLVNGNTITSFAPANGQAFTNKDLSDNINNFKYSEYYDFKDYSSTFMHPPRNWSGNKLNKSYTVSAQVAENKNNIDIYTDMHSAQQVSDAEGQLYTSPIQSKIVEDQLNTVYFVPVRFPEGEEGNTPALFTKSFNLPLSLLKNGEESAIIETDVEEAATVPNVCEDGKNFYEGDCAFSDTDKKGDPQYKDNDWIFENMDYEFSAGRRTNIDYDQSEVGDSPKDEDIIKWSYVQQCGSGEVDCVNENYQDMGYKYFDSNNPTGSDRSIPSPDRNEIAKRYVSVFMAAGRRGGDVLNPFGYSNSQVLDSRQAAQAQPPQRPKEDPFSSKVKCSQGDGHQSWYAIGMDFNKNGEFLGYISRYCYPESSSLDTVKHKNKDTWANAENGFKGVQFATFATMKEQCVDFASVYDENNIQSHTNKAWTNNVWENADDNFPDQDSWYDSVQDFDRNTFSAPFGTIASERDNNYLRNAANKNIGELRGYVFDDITDGIPLRCNFDKDQHFFTDIRNCSGLEYADAIDDISSYDNTSSTKDMVLDNLFVKIFNRVDLTGNNSSVSPTNTDKSGANYEIMSSVEQRYLRPPEVYSVDPSCLNEGESTGSCPAGEKDNITVNGMTGITDKDYNNDSIADEGTGLNWEGLIGVGVFPANIKFYAFADKNRMPIKKVKVDWGDAKDYTGSTKTGYYKNRKPYCGNYQGEEVSECVEIDPNLPGTRAGRYFTGLTCNSDKECSMAHDSQNMNYECEDEAGTSGKRYITPKSFGNSSRACKEDYFERHHTYNCGARELADKDIPQTVSSTIQTSNGTNERLRERLLNKGLSMDSEVCVYKPSVQVTDNWGWCNGDCDSHLPEGGIPGQDEVDHPNGGCYNEPKNMQCKDNPKAWTSFKGKIIVIPPEQFRE